MFASHSMSVGTGPEALDRRGVQRPHLIAHRRVVRIDAHLAPVNGADAVPGEVHLLHRTPRNAVEIAARVEAMIHRVDVDVVHVEQQAAARFVRERGQEIPFGRCAERVNSQIARDVLDEDLAAEKILHLPHAIAHVPQRFFGVGQRQQIVREAPADGAPQRCSDTSMRLEVAHESRDLREMRAIERIGRADGEPDAMQAQRIVLAHLAEHARQRARRARSSSRCALRTSRRRAARDDLSMMNRAQPDAGAQSARRRGGAWRCGSLRRPRDAWRYGGRASGLRGERAARRCARRCPSAASPIPCRRRPSCQALAGMRGARAIVLAGLRHAVAFLGLAPLFASSAANAGPRERDQAADRRREDCSLRIHRIDLLRAVE